MISNSCKLTVLNRLFRFNRSVRSYSQKSQIASNDGLLLSDNCVQKLKQLCEEHTFLRLCVESGGCSGFQYKFDIDSKIGEEDKVFERDGVKVVVDETSLEYIRGSTIDYHTELIRSAFRVEKNPNADIGCSCGASFSIKID